MNTNKEYKVFFMEHEYRGYTGYEKCAIATDLSEDELRAKYGAELGGFEPFILISWEAGVIMTEYRNNDAKFRMRAWRGEEVQLNDAVEEFATEEDIEIKMTTELIMEALNKLCDDKRELFLDHYYFGYTCQEIADRSGRSRQAVSQDLLRVTSKVKTILVKMGVAA